MSGRLTLQNFVLNVSKSLISLILRLLDILFTIIIKTIVEPNKIRAVVNEYKLPK